MAINFPVILDSLTNPLATDKQNNPSHSTQHSNANDILEALEAKVGIDNSSDTTSLDYKVTHSIPYTGANSDIDLGTHTLTATGIASKAGGIFAGAITPFPTGYGIYVANYVSGTYGARILAYDGTNYQPLYVGKLISGSTFQLALNSDGTSVFGGTVSATNLSGTNTGDNAANTTSNSYADGKIIDSIADADTTHAPSGNAVFDALALKAPLTSPSFATSIIGSYLTASQILGTDASKKIISLPVATYPSLTELTYLKGVTSAIQTQLNGKQASGSYLTSANIEDSIVDGHTTISPSGNAVFDALALKAPLANPTFTEVITSPQIINSQNNITATSNAATVPITYRLNEVTNNSAATLTITLTTSGAVDGQLCLIKVVDYSAVAQTIVWVNTENSLLTAPTTSNGSTTLHLTTMWQFNSATSKWRFGGSF